MIDFGGKIDYNDLFDDDYKIANKRLCENKNTFPFIDQIQNNKINDINKEDVSYV